MKQKEIALMAKKISFKGSKPKADKQSNKITRMGGLMKKPFTSPSPKSRRAV